jgi:hypothetical protein
LPTTSPRHALVELDHVVECVGDFPVDAGEPDRQPDRKFTFAESSQGGEKIAAIEFGGGNRRFLHCGALSDWRGGTRAPRKGGGPVIQAQRECAGGAFPGLRASLPDAGASFANRSPRQLLANGLTLTPQTQITANGSAWTALFDLRLPKRSRHNQPVIDCAYRCEECWQALSPQGHADLAPAYHRGSADVPVDN